MESQKLKMTMADPGHHIEISRGVEPLDEEPDEPAITMAVEHVLNTLEWPNSEVSIRLVSVEEIRNLNETYRGQQGETNVLSFPAGLSLENMKVLGDVVVCTRVVAEEAARFDKRFPDRFRHMLVHGLLHLLGYDHMAEKEREEMEDLEIRLLSQLGVRNPYE